MQFVWVLRTVKSAIYHPFPALLVALLAIPFGDFLQKSHRTPALDTHQPYRSKSVVPIHCSGAFCL